MWKIVFFWKIEIFGKFGFFGKSNFTKTKFLKIGKNYFGKLLNMSETKLQHKNLTHFIGEEYTVYSKK